MKASLATGALLLMAMAVAVSYASALGSHPCATFVEGSCPQVGAQGLCPDGTKCTWSVISEWDEYRTLCSCYTEGCGPGPCNRLVQWRGKMRDMGCYGTELLPCKIKHCWEAKTVRVSQYPSLNCDLDPCNGPCPHPVFPL